MKYKKTNLTILITLALMLLSISAAEAKWWIFGQSEDTVEISYLFLNKASFDETGSKITLFKEMLPEGKVTINGKAAGGKSKIGSVRISLDGKETWSDANLSESGAFEFSFRPEMDKTYSIFIEVSDTTGKTNDVAATARQVVLSDRNVMSIIRETLDKMIAAYEDRNPKTFMALVSEDFAGDMTNLDRAIRKDFSSFDDIDLNYTLNNITSDSKGISVSLSYHRSLLSTKDPDKKLKDKGITEFVFKMGDKGAKVYSMKNPLIFGVTGAPSVATGTVAPATNDPIIIADSRGNATMVPAQTFSQMVMDDSLKITNEANGSSKVEASGNTVNVDKNGQQTSGGNPSETVEKGPRTLVLQGHPAQPMGFIFADGEVTSEKGDFMINGPGYGNLGTGVRYKNMGNVGINTIAEAPDSGYSQPGEQVYFEEGYTYAFLLADGKYGLMEVTQMSIVEDWQAQPPIMTITMRFTYKYQTSGKRQFLP